MDLLKDFESKDELELAMWLKDQGISSETCQKFEDEEIGGSDFLDMTEVDIKSLVPKLGIVKKLCRLQNLVRNSKEGTGASTPTASRPSTPISVPSPLPLASPFPSTASTTGSEVSDFEESSTPSLSRKFVVPSMWRPSIMGCLSASTDEEMCRLLTTSIRNEIVRDLVTQMFALQTKPDRSFCTSTAKALVKKYPLLKDKGKNVTGYGSWEKKIIERVHNVQSSSARKRLSSSSGDDDRPRKKGRTAGSKLISRYPPLFNMDDDISTERNKKLLRKELEKDKGKIKKDIVLSLMSQCYAHRREYIMSETEDVTVASILSDYPAFTLPYIIEQEIELILEKRSVAATAENDWKIKWAPAINKYVETLKGKQYRQNEQMIEERAQERAEKVALLHLVTLLTTRKSSSNSTMYIYEECKISDCVDDVCACAPARTAPRIACFPDYNEDCSYYLFVEQVVLFSVSTFSRALMLWFMCHYVFNLEYAKQVKDVALFFQEFVFNLPQKSGSKSATYLTTTTDIGTLVCVTDPRMVLDSDSQDHS